MNLLCFSHLRWNFVYQRPQHLMSRFNNHYPVFFIEEPSIYSGPDTYSIHVSDQNVRIVTPKLGNNEDNYNKRLRNVIDLFIEEQKIGKFIAWYYTPMALLFTNHLKPVLTIYDCMDELSAFKFAPPELKEAEQNLFERADIVFTGGYSLYKAKKHLHNNIHAFPSSIEKEHFAKARKSLPNPQDQQSIPKPRLGFYGVIDERFDIDLIAKVADARPEWQFILIGPIVKISEESLPKNKNIHYLGGKTYNQLPAYLSNWDIALIPFAINESTRYISPTKTPEYLAAGKPVITTPVADIIHTYKNVTHIVSSTMEFIAAAEYEFNNNSRKEWLQKTDKLLAKSSWNATWQDMQQVINEALQRKFIKPPVQKIPAQTLPVQKLPVQKSKETFTANI